MRAIVVVSISAIGAFVTTAQLAPVVFDLLIGRDALAPIGAPSKAVAPAPSANASKEAAAPPATRERVAAAAPKQTLGPESVAAVAPAGPVEDDAEQEALAPSPSRPALEATTSDITGPATTVSTPSAPTMTAAVIAELQAAENEAPPPPGAFAVGAAKPSRPQPVSSEPAKRAEPELLEQVVASLASPKGTRPVSPEPEPVTSASLTTPSSVAAPVVETAIQRPDTPVERTPSNRPGQVATHLVSKAGVNARFAPGLGEEVLAVLPLGARLAALPIESGAAPGWGYFVVISGAAAGQTVWIHRSLIEAAAPKQVARP